jgi:hypothetical protein
MKKMPEDKEALLRQVAKSMLNEFPAILDKKTRRKLQKIEQNCLFQD